MAAVLGAGGVNVNSQRRNMEQIESRMDDYITQLVTKYVQLRALRAEIAEGREMAALEGCKATAGGAAAASYEAMQRVLRETKQREVTALQNEIIDLRKKDIKNIFSHPDAKFIVSVVSLLAVHLLVGSAVALPSYAMDVTLGAICGIFMQRIVSNGIDRRDVDDLCKNLTGAVIGAVSSLAIGQKFASYFQMTPLATEVAAPLLALGTGLLGRSFSRITEKCIHKYVDIYVDRLMAKP